MFTEYDHSKMLRYPFWLGAFCYLFTGVGHLGTVTVSYLGTEPAELNKLLATMPTVNLLGRMVNFYWLSTGFSVAMGVLMIGFGLSCWFNPSRPRGLKVTATLMSGVMFAIAAITFFSVPMAAMGLASAFFLLSLFEKQKNAPF
ncbi:MAG: hypothetical protein AAF633_18880 [Chloroflexota bacterium]